MIDPKCATWRRPLSFMPRLYRPVASCPASLNEFVRETDKKYYCAEELFILWMIAPTCFVTVGDTIIFTEHYFAGTIISVYFFEMTNNYLLPERVKIRAGK